MSLQRPKWTKAMITEALNRAVKEALEERRLPRHERTVRVQERTTEMFRGFDERHGK